MSACLFGHVVRYDGTAKRAAWLLEPPFDQVELVPLCPEDGSGMGTPREPIELVGEPGGRPRVMTVHTHREVTQILEAWIGRHLPDVRGLAGYVFKARSPSCGPKGVELRAEQGPGVEVTRQGVGVWAAAIQAAHPDMPVADEDDLQGEEERVDFIERVLSYAPGGRR